MQSPTMRRVTLLASFFLLSLSALPCALSQNAQPMPRIEGESLSGHKVVLPDATSGKVAVLIFGFTKASKTPTGQWDDKLTAEFGKNAQVEIYQLPVLEAVPRFIRGMVISGIKKGTAENKRDHMAPILQHESELKTMVHYKEPDDAYIVIVDRAGNITEQTHGPLNHGPLDEENYSRLRSAIDRALAQK